MLYLVPTPIGNLEDITLRALRILKEADFILAEDTRTSKNLLNHYEIQTPLTPFHLNNEHKLVDKYTNELKQGKTIALVSDAGTPGISDPGFLLVRSCLENELEVECLPGATALIPALVKSGLPSDRFVFEGFLPHKKGRKTKFETLEKEERTVILYESPHRILKTLNQIMEYMGPDRVVSVSRELTKKFEETITKPVSELIEQYEKGEATIKGEFVLVIKGKNVK